MFYPPQAVAYAGTAYMAAAWYQMGTTPEIGNLAFEVYGNLAGTGANGTDADPALVIFDFLTAQLLAFRHASGAFIVIERIVPI